MENNELSKFIKFTYKQGKVKDVEEAFKDYATAKEWHQGKIENVLHEKTIV